MFRITKTCLPALVLLGGFTAIPAFAAFVVTVENPGVQDSLTPLSSGGVERFDNIATGLQSVTTGYGTGTAITGSYTQALIFSADAFGGAGGVGKYISADGNFGPSSYTLTLGGAPVNYFGFWFSAASAGNSIDFYKSNSLLYTFTAQDLLSRIDSRYYGNPNNGRDAGEEFAFVNFYNTSGSFDRIVFNSNGNGLESDNHTVGTYASTTGTFISAVPEPSALLTLSAGAGLTGWLARRRRPNRRS